MGNFLISVTDIITHPPPDLHLLRYGLSLGEDVSQVSSPQNVPQGGGGEQPRQISKEPSSGVQYITWQTHYSRPRWSRH